MSTSGQGFRVQNEARELVAIAGQSQQVLRRPEVSQAAWRVVVRVAEIHLLS